MIKIVTCSASCLSGLLLIVVNLPAATSDDALKELVLSEYPKALAALEAKFANCSGEGIYVQKKKSPAGKLEVMSSSHVEYSFSGDNGRVWMTSIGKEDTKADPSKPETPGKAARPVEKVLNYTKKRSFNLTKKSADSDFLVRWMSDGPKDGLSEINRRPGLAALHGPSWADTKPISNLLAQPGFRWDRVSEIKEASQPRRLRLEFTIPRMSSEKRVVEVTAGWLVVTPEDQWVLRESGLVRTAVTGGGRTDVGHFEYERNPSGEIRPLKFDTSDYRGILTADPATSGSGQASPFGSEEFQFTKFRFGTTPDREFTLSAFGLPEFGETAAPRPTPPLAWWIFGAAIATLGVALTLRRFSSRPRPTTQP